MSVIINFTAALSEKENILIEFQGTLTHTIENKFNLMFLGRLNHVANVNIKILIYLGCVFYEYW